MRVKREDVLDFVISRGSQAFTTTDVAEALGVKEYAVRAAVSWLVLDEFIAFHEMHPTREHVKVYRWTGKAGAIPTVRRNRDEREFVQACRKFSPERDSGVSILDSAFKLMKQRNG